MVDQEIRRRFERILGDISDHATLERDWDSYGGNTPTQQAIAAAKHLVRAIFSQYEQKVGLRAVPYHASQVPNGGIEVEWQSPSIDVEIEIGPRGEYAYLLIDRRGPRREMTERDNVSYEEVLQVISRMVEAQR